MKHYAKNLKEYKSVEIDEVAIKKSYAELKQSKKHPTSINLTESVILELKSIAQKKGIPYQTLMRSFILDGLKKIKDAA